MREGLIGFEYIGKFKVVRDEARWVDFFGPSIFSSIGVLTVSTNRVAIEIFRSHRASSRVDRLDHANAFVAENSVWLTGSDVALENMQVGAAYCGL